MALALAFVSTGGTKAQPLPKPPTALAVIAHPDDEGAFSVILYKIARELKGQVDICVITNGEGGYKYATLSEPLYEMPLSEEATGRRNLPKIRRRELINAGKILGIRKIYFLDQRDAHYTQNEREPLDTSWNVPQVASKLDKLLHKPGYDFVFVLPPTATTHGGHKAATILALQAAARLTEGRRPVVLTGFVRTKTDTAIPRLTGLPRYPETRLASDTALFRIDLKPGLGYQGKLNYNIIKNWEIAEHKSQGTMQLFMARNADYEIFWPFALNAPGYLERCRALFAALEAATPKPTR